MGLLRRTCCKRHCRDHELPSTATYLLAHAVMANSFQRPGAVINLTVQEFQDPKEETYSGGIIRVRQHKTKAQGSANLLMTEPLMKRMKSYLEVLRPLTMGTDITNKFFLKNGGKELDFMAKRIEVLAKRYGFCYVTSTDIRKAVATEATKNLNLEERYRSSCRQWNSTLTCIPPGRLSTWLLMQLQNQSRRRQQLLCQIRQVHQQQLHQNQRRRKGCPSPLQRPDLSGHTAIDAGKMIKTKAIR